MWVKSGSGVCFIERIYKTSRNRLRMKLGEQFNQYNHHVSVNDANQCPNFYPYTDSIIRFLVTVTVKLDRMPDRSIQVPAVLS